MNAEIQNLIDHPEAIQETLNTAQLDRLIRKATAVWGQTITMRYRVSQGRSEARFDAESEQDLVGSSGIFAKVLTSCKIDTFSSCLTYTPATGYRVWFTLHLSYQHEWLHLLEPRRKLDRFGIWRQPRQRRRGHGDGGDGQRQLRSHGRG